MDLAHGSCAANSTSLDASLIHVPGSLHGRTATTPGNAAGAGNAEKWSDLHATFTTVQPARARHFYFSSAWQRCKWEIQLPNYHTTSSKANNDNYI